VLPVPGRIVGLVFRVDPGRIPEYPSLVFPSASPVNFAVFSRVAFRLKVRTAGILLFFDRLSGRRIFTPLQVHMLVRLLAFD